MAKIVVKHSSIIINNYNLGDSPRLENFFSVYDRICHASFLKGIEYIEEEKKLILPRGIDIYFLESLFGEKAMVDRRNDEYEKTDPIMIKYLPRDDVQKEALCFMLGEKLQYRDNKSKSQLSVNLNTGVGKTYCAIATVSYLCLRSIIITSSTGWLEQWKKCIVEYTDTRPNEIYMLTGTPSVLSLLKKDMSKYKFILASHATIKSYGDRFGWDKVTELFKYMKVGLKFYDESHLNFDNMTKIDYYTNTFRTYYVTATPARSSEEENKIFQLYFKNVPAIDLFNEEEDPHTQYIAMKYSSKPTPQQISECKNQYGLDRNKYTNYVVNQDNIYKMLTILVDMCLKKEGKTLIYIGTNDAINIIKEWLLNNYPILEYSVGVYTSLTPSDIKAEQLNKKIILSTTKSCGAAVDIKGLSRTIVLAEPFKSEVLARQTLGRTRDDNTTYIEIVDTAFVQINKYYYSKKPIFDKYATKCTEIIIKQDELDYRYETITHRNAFKREIKTIMKQVDNFNPKKPFFESNEPWQKPILKQVMFTTNKNRSIV
ncbi:MAG: DEAD/DEAH box helicase family protein [Peptostreptococcaceae bacterium]